MNSKVTLESGHELTMGRVPFKAASRLRRVVASELKGVAVHISDGLIPALLSRDQHQVLASLTGVDINTLKNLAFQLLASEEVEEAVLACMVKWQLEGEAIKAETFEPDDRRGDLIPCAVEVGRHALLPFFASLGLKLSAPQKTEAASGQT